MTFTEEFIKIPALIPIPNIETSQVVVLRVMPRDLHGYFSTTDHETNAYFSGFGLLNVQLPIEEFEKQFNDFVGEPVTASEKHIAIMGKMLDKLNDDKL